MSMHWFDWVRLIVIFMGVVLILIGTYFIGW